MFSQSLRLHKLFLSSSFWKISPGQSGQTVSPVWPLSAAVDFLDMPGISSKVPFIQVLFPNQTNPQLYSDFSESPNSTPPPSKVMSIHPTEETHFGGFVIPNVPFLFGTASHSQPNGSSSLFPGMTPVLWRCWISSQLLCIENRRALKPGDGGGNGLIKPAQPQRQRNDSVPRPLLSPQCCLEILSVEISDEEHRRSRLTETCLRYSSESSSCCLVSLKHPTNLVRH